MVKLNKIYTKTGDDGTTGLVSGQRIDKNDLRVEAFGTVDETNAAIGLVRFELVTEENGAANLDQQVIEPMLARIQNDLFDLGADLATPIQENENPAKVLRVQKNQVAYLEHDIDELNETISPLTSFILPSGLKGVAQLHLARTICRRAERRVVSLMQSEPINNEAMLYLNRLSDYLFVAGRYLNEKGQKDVLWIPGENRER